MKDNTKDELIDLNGERLDYGDYVIRLEDNRPLIRCIFMEITANGDGLQHGIKPGVFFTSKMAQASIKIKDSNGYLKKRFMLRGVYEVEYKDWLDSFKTSRSPEDAQEQGDKLKEVQSTLHNNHYAKGGLHQPIEAMQANLTPEEFKGYLRGNIIKYCCRYGKKDERHKEADKIYIYAKWLKEAEEGLIIDPKATL